MKVLLDSSCPVQMSLAFANQEVHTVSEMGWGEYADAELLREAELAGFDLLIHCEHNFQRPDASLKRHLAIIELWTNHRPTIERLLPLIRLHSNIIRPGEYRALAAP